ncbi:hypothetical protein MHBO_000837, partial [Bonamia ostreae]
MTTLFKTSQNLIDLAFFDPKFIENKAFLLIKFCKLCDKIKSKQQINLFFAIFKHTKNIKNNEDYLINFATKILRTTKNQRLLHYFAQKFSIEKLDFVSFIDKISENVKNLEIIAKRSFLILLKNMAKNNLIDQCFPIIKIFILSIKSTQLKNICYSQLLFLSSFFECTDTKNLLSTFGDKIFILIFFEYYRDEENFHEITGILFNQSLNEFLKMNQKSIFPQTVINCDLEALKFLTERLKNDQKISKNFSKSIKLALNLQNFGKSIQFLQNLYKENFEDLLQKCVPKYIFNLACNSFSKTEFSENSKILLKLLKIDFGTDGETAKSSKFSNFIEKHFYCLIEKFAKGIQKNPGKNLKILRKILKIVNNEMIFAFAPRILTILMSTKNNSNFKKRIEKILVEMIPKLDKNIDKFMLPLIVVAEKHFIFSKKIEQILFKNEKIKDKNSRII